MRDRALDGRIRKGEMTRRTIISVVLVFLDHGDFRPTVRQIAQASGVGPSTVISQFGSLELLYRVIAREQPERVLAAAGIENGAPDSLARGLAWTIMVGKPRELS